MFMNELKEIEKIINNNKIISYVYNNFLYYKIYNYNKNEFNKSFIKKLKKEIKNIENINLFFYENEKILKICFFNKKENIILIDIELYNYYYNELKKDLLNKNYNIIIKEKKDYIIL